MITHFSIRSFLRFLLAAQLLSFTTVHSQAPVAKQAGPPVGATVLHTGTRLVIVDVTVVDKDGRPVRGLKREDFTLTESKQLQAVSHFEEHSSQTVPVAGPELPPMPPGTFTDYTSVPPSGSLNILLLDSLNTPMSDQAYVRNQLRQFVKKAKPGTRIAIFGLSQRLFLLQGFNSTTQALKDAVEHKLRPHSSSLLDDGMGMSDVTTDIPDSQDPQDVEVASTLQQFEAEQASFQTQLRIQYTLDAFNDLAHYLSAFPGRKNLIWFSGSFPINILPDPTLQNSFAVMEDNSPEFRETTNLLSRAQVAVYPVDARGIMTDPTYSASSTLRSTGLSANQPGKSSAAFYQSQVDEHMSMSRLAEDTGGTAFYNTNDFASAVQSAIEDGSNYYTLAYTPTERNANGLYQEIRVSLNGNLQNSGYRLTYRHGYYSDEPHKFRKESPSATTTAKNVVSTSSGDTYAHAAMAHGAPMPEDILFKARVLPIGKVAEQTLATDNHVDPTHPIKPPFRRFAVDLAAVAEAFQLTLEKDGRRSGAVEYDVLLYDNDGRLLNAAGRAVQFNLTPEAYKRFINGVNAHLEISVPIKGGDDFLRIGIRDIPSNRFGVVEVPLSSVAHLTPLPAKDNPVQTGSASH